MVKLAFSDLRREDKSDFFFFLCGSALPTSSGAAQGPG